MKDRLKSLMSIVFEVSVNEINESSSSETILNWDSLRHMTLITVIEEEFKIILDDEEILRYTSLNVIEESLIKKIQNFH